MDIDGLFPPEREKGLRGIMRYSMVQTMFYRPSVWLHAHRVSWIAEDLVPQARRHLPGFRPERALIMALVHDDAELLTGDVQAGHKAVMNKKELRAVERNEAAGIEKLAKRYPGAIGGYAYKDLLTDILHKRSPDAWLVSLADKMDAYCESLHELLAGNMSFIEPVMFYTDTLSGFDRKFPGLKNLLAARGASFSDFRGRADYRKIRDRFYAPFGRPHTTGSLRTRTNFPFYDRWRELTLAKMGKEGKKALLLKKEGVRR